MKRVAFIVLTLAASCSQQEIHDDGIQIETSVDRVQEEQPAPATPETVVEPGQYIEYHPNGGVKIKGIYNDDLQREGLWVSYYDNGVKWSESYYVNGKLDGHTLTFYPNGQVRYIGEFRNDQKTGTWTFYDENGNVVKEEKY